MAIEGASMVLRRPGTTYSLPLTQFNGAGRNVLTAPNGDTCTIEPE